MDTDSMTNHVPTDFYSIPISSYATGRTTSNASTLTTDTSNVFGIVNKTTNLGIGGNATAAAEQTASPPPPKPTAPPVFTLMKRNATLFTNAIMVIAFRIKLAPRVFYSILIFSFVIGQKMSRVRKSQKTQRKATSNVFGNASRIVSHGIGGSVTRHAGIAPS
jgi:ABC-type multidrug transport system fused ATPase/permease subunit